MVGSGCWSQVEGGTTRSNARNLHSCFGCCIFFPLHVAFVQIRSIIWLKSNNGSTSYGRAQIEPTDGIEEPTSYNKLESIVLFFFGGYFIVT